MAFSDTLLEDGSDIWKAQKRHPFVEELADGSLDDSAFQWWIKQDYRYLLDYARTFAIASAKAREESAMAGLIEIAHSTLHVEMDLHRSFAEEYGIDAEALETVDKAPMCEAYTSFLLRTAYEGSIPEISAALYPCGQGYLDIADHAESLSDSTHSFTPWIEIYTSEEFRDLVANLRNLVDRYGEQYPGKHEAMREAFLTSARFELHFWDMAYSQQSWDV